MDLRPLGRPLRLTLLLAALLYLLDGFVLGSLWTVLILVVVVRFLRFAATERVDAPDTKGRLEGLRILVYVALIGLSAGTLHLHDRGARQRAAEVVTAVERFHDDQQRYPGTLEELVPAYLPAVPRARYTLAFSHFRYSGGEGSGGYLMWARLPPYGWVAYLFQDRRWTFGVARVGR